MLNVQTFLLEKHKTLSREASLEALSEFGIKARLYPNDDLVLLDYSQIDSPKSHPIVIECRSLILKISDFSVVSRKFDRFFNAGECPEYYGDFVLSRAKVMEKADGSLCGIYYNDHTNQWEISTRGMAKADGPHMMGGTFRDKILSAMGLTEEKFQAVFNSHDGTWRGNTFVMEFVSPENRIVTKYDTPHMVLLGVTHSSGTADAASEILGIVCNVLRGLGINVRSLKTYDIKTTLAELINDANNLSGLQEGFVVWDEISGKRMKIKSSTYVIAHRLRGDDVVPTRKNLMILVLDGEVDEFLIYFPEWSSLIDEIRVEVSAFETSLVKIYDKYSPIEDQKEFALKVKDERGAGILFSARKLKLPPLKVFHESAIQQKLKIFVV